MWSTHPDSMLFVGSRSAKTRKPTRRRIWNYWHAKSTTAQSRAPCFHVMPVRPLRSQDRAYHAFSREQLPPTARFGTPDLSQHSETGPNTCRVDLGRAPQRRRGYRLAAARGGGSGALPPERDGTSACVQGPALRRAGNAWLSTWPVNGTGTTAAAEVIRVAACAARCSAVIRGYPGRRPATRSRWPTGERERISSPWGASSLPRSPGRWLEDR
ncbi:hypothetical protein GGR56DRAFT_185060 [Xylariaceae sp. FL0804]|nr:hypothetical protein GGR56DRAFT_185060 [Xylariaceae sp. FL0804]